MTVTDDDRRAADAFYARAVDVLGPIKDRPRGCPTTIRECLDEAFAAHREAAIASERAAVVALIQKRMDVRFNENGTREWDTGWTGYTGRAAEIFEAEDEEDEAIIAAIKARTDHSEQAGEGEK